MSGSHQIHVCDINGTIFKSYLAHRWDTLRSCQIVCVYVRVCCVMSGCIMHVVSCQDMLTHVGAMSDVPGDVRECWGRQGLVNACNGVL